MTRRRPSRRIAKAGLPAPTGEDATPERMAHGPSEVVQADSDGQGTRAHTVRRIIPRIELLRDAGKITPAQFAAGDWLRKTSEKAQAEPKVTMGWEASISSSGGPSLGFLPANERQMRARQMLRAAYITVDRHAPGTRTILTRVVFDDEWPRSGGRAIADCTDRIRRALDAVGLVARVS